MQRILRNTSLYKPFQCHIANALDVPSVGTCGGGRGGGGGVAAGKVGSSVPVNSIVDSVVEWLEKTNVVGVRNTDGVPQAVLEERVEHFGIPENNGRRYDHNEDDKDGEVENGEADNTSLAQLRLLEGVDGRTDLSAGRHVSVVRRGGNHDGSTNLGRSQNRITEWNLST